MWLLAIVIYIFVGLAFQSAYYRFRSKAFANEPYWKTFFSPYKTVGSFRYKAELDKGETKHPEQLFVAKAAQRYWAWVYFWINAGIFIVPQITFLLSDEIRIASKQNHWLAFFVSSGAAMLLSLFVLMAFIVLEAILLFVFVLRPSIRVGKIQKSIRLKTKGSAPQPVQKLSSDEPAAGEPTKV